MNSGWNVTSTGPVASGTMLGDDDLGDALLLLILGVVVLVAIDEHHHVCVLFDGIRFRVDRRDVAACLSLASKDRLSWETAIIGTSSSRARFFRFRVISEISC